MAMMQGAAPRRNYNAFSHCTFGVRQGDPALEIATNLTNWFELGNRSGDDYWLEGVVVGESDFVFNGRLFLPNGPAGTLIGNFPKNAVPNGWIKRPRVDGEGYELVSPDGVIIFGYRIENRICHMAVNIYASDGEIVAESTSNEFRIYRPPLKIGRSGVLWT
jgi:hypothetical protein